MFNEMPAPELPRRAPPNRWRQRIVLVLLLAVGVPVGATLMHYFPPTQPNSIIPGCTFYWLTGCHCAGCGATRAMYSLLHGDLEQAFAFNSLFILLLPLLGFAALRVLFEIWTGRKAPAIRVPGWVIGILIATLIAYSIARNIDVYPLTLLAPHVLQ